ncbi:hypothetical protein KFK09_006079 [Dendrobium nobile]|uniref:Uncharacterized protein n=1 Tax=Dendrobium nobile TaxID=94219 RepID=A0A8T3BSH8_DENNO|nr:hypothetical protein KFK09_006079 [Dendrobium nobile]
MNIDANPTVKMIAHLRTAEVYTWSSASDLRSFTLAAISFSPLSPDAGLHAYASGEATWQLSGGLQTLRDCCENAEG